MPCRFVSLLTFFFFLSNSGAAQQGFVNDTTYVVKEIVLQGNKVTKPFIIRREMTFREDDTITSTLLEKEMKVSRQNIFNTSLFNFVQVSATCLPDTVSDGWIPCRVIVEVKERWYTWPVPVFDVAEQNMNTWWRNGHNLARASYGFYLNKYNFRGRKETVAAIFRFGYARQLGAQYSVPYLNKKQTLGVTMTGLYTMNHEVAYASNNNQLVFYKDRDRFIRKETSFSMKWQYRKNIFHRHTLDLRFTDLRVNDTVLDLHDRYFDGGKNRMRYLSVSWQWVREYRDVRVYPLSGHYTDLELTKHGLGMMKDESLDVFFVAASIRKYFSLGKRFYSGVMLKGRWLPGRTPPYYHQRALGFSTYVRGYEYYVVDGQSYALFKSAFKYQILPPRVFTLNWLPLEKFNTVHVALYGGVFFDGARVENRYQSVFVNSMGNRWLYGYGAGLDLVTYYDLVFRLEYAFNHLGQGGLYLHMGAPF